MWERPGLFQRHPPTLVERGLYALGWAVDYALIKPRAIRQRLRAEWQVLRGAYRRGLNELKPGQFGYGHAERVRAEYASERAAATGASDRQVA